jgi:ribonuclease HII
MIKTRNFDPMLILKHSPDLLECGTDEAGRGCLAGPVTAAAVILKDEFASETLNDSKLLQVETRNELRTLIEKEALCFAVNHVMMDEIDKINILHASILGMHRSIGQLSSVPEHILVDGNFFKPYEKIPYQCVIKGDGKYMSIAAASVLAKTYRDAYMEKIHEEFPLYNWKQNKGYATREHREAIREHGITKYHRKSFQLLPGQLKFGFDVCETNVIEVDESKIKVSVIK